MHHRQKLTDLKEPVCYLGEWYTFYVEVAKYHTKQTPWPLARKRTIPTELPPLVGEI
jgi:hypothetical protein